MSALILLRTTPVTDMGSSSDITFGTKTSYVPPSTREPLDVHKVFPATADTRLVHVTLVARHGTRNPTKSCLDRMQRLKSWLRKALPTPHPVWLDEWDNQLDIYSQNPGELTEEGEQELWHIGERFALNYASELHQSGAAIRVRSSYKHRAIASARAFLDGYSQTCQDLQLPVLFALDDTYTDSDSDSLTGARSQQDSSSDTSIDDEAIEVLPSGQDASLRFYERHTEYAEFTGRYKEAVQSAFVRGSMHPIFSTLATRIGSALGAKEPMDVEFVRIVSESCAFDYAHGRVERSGFSPVLCREDSKLLEFAEIRCKPFFKAHELFRAVAAPLIADIINSFSSCISGVPEAGVYAADLAFAHAETIVPMLLLLGIHSNGLSPDDPDYRAGLSGMSPFAGNLIIELYESRDEATASYYVRFRLHERYVTNIPALGEHCRNGVVPLEHLIAFFDEVLAEGLHDFN